MCENDQSVISDRTHQRGLPSWTGIVGIALVLVLVGLVWKGLQEAPAEPLPELELSELKKVEGRFYIAGETNVFSGIVVENYEDGSPKSRTVVADGLLNGKSEGWYPSGQLQVQEFFVDGVANGRKTKWWENGQKLSDGEVAEGEWHGLYRKWHENGQLSQEIPMKQGKAHGVAKAWFPSGTLKSRVEMAEGETVKSEFFEDVAAPSEEPAQGPAENSRG